MAGMYTKHYLEDGRIYYFNATLNVSVWNPPTDNPQVLVHEAPNARPPSAAYYSEQPPPEYMNPPPMYYTDNSINQFSAPSSSAPPLEESIIFAHEPIQVAPPKKVAKSRFRATRTEETETSAYLKQKSEFERAAGNKADDTGKWLVR